MKAKVAILYICTGKYDVFWKDFYMSYEKFFLPDSEKEYFVFTDAESIYCEEQEHVHKIFQESLGWPDNTLKRFHIFLRIKDELVKFDYVFFMNANCLCLDYISEEEFLPKDKGILVVQHPGYYDKKPEEFAYDRNPKCEAYISKGAGKYYICGGVNGGKTEAFLKLIEELKARVDRDEQKSIVAKWHDESHINRYIIDNLDYEILSPAYCYPEDWNLPFECKIMIRNKSKVIDIVDVKEVGLRKVIERVRVKVQKIKSYIKRKILNRR